MKNGNLIFEEKRIYMNFGKINQYILFGGGQLLALTVQLLKKEGLSVFVVTSERHSNEIITIDSQSMALLEFLKYSHIDCIVSKDVSTDLNIINKVTENTMGMSFGAAWIFKKQFIDLFRGRLLNSHGTRLPQNRGGGGFSWRILIGERIGVSLIHQIDPGVDTGNIIFFEEYIFPSQCRLPIEYYKYSIEKYQDLLERFFTFIKEEKSFIVTSQQEYFSSYWPRLATDIHGYIDWNWALNDIERFVCAFDDPYNGASTFVNNSKVRLKKCYASFNDGIFHPFQKGIIYRINETTIFVATEQGSLLVNSVLNESGVDIKKKLRLGDRFYTPIRYLEEAKQSRVFYTPEGQKKI